MNDRERERLLEDASRLLEHWAEVRASGLVPGSALEESCDAELKTLEQLPVSGLGEQLSLLREGFRSAFAAALSTKLKSLGSKRGRSFLRPKSLKSLSEQLATLDSHIDFHRLEVAGLLRCEDAHSYFEAYRSLLQLSEQAGIEEGLALERLVIEIHKRIGGTIRWPWLARSCSRYSDTFRSLFPLSPAAKAEVQQIYRKRYSRELADALQVAFTGVAEESLKSILENRTADAFFLRLSMVRRRTGKSLAWGLLDDLELHVETLSRNERKALSGELQSRLKRYPRLSTSVVKKFGSAYLRRAIDVSRGSRAEVDAGYAEIYLLRSPTKVALRIARRSLEQRLQLARVFEQEYSETLVTSVNKHVSSKSLSAWINELLHGDEEAALVYRVQSIFERENDEWLGELLRNISAERRASFVGTFETLLPGESFETRLKQRYRSRECEIVTDILLYGSVSRAKLLWFCVAGLGTDEAGVLKLLSHIPAAEYADLREQFRRIWQLRCPWYERFFPNWFGDLQKRLWLECAGDSWCDLEGLLRTQESEEAWWSCRLRSLEAHERSGQLFRRLDFFSHEGDTLESDLKSAWRLIGEYEQDAPSGRKYEDHHRAILSAVRLSELDSETVRDLKHFVGDRLANLVTGAGVFCCVLSISLFSGDLSVIMLAAGSVSLAFRLGLKQVLKGRSYHRDELGLDLFFAILDGTTLFLGRVLRRALIRSGAKFASRLGLRTGIDRVLRRFREVSTEFDPGHLRELVDEPAEPELILSRVIPGKTEPYQRLSALIAKADTLSGQ